MGPIPWVGSVINLSVLGEPGTVVPVDGAADDGLVDPEAAIGAVGDGVVASGGLASDVAGAGLAPDVGPELPALQPARSSAAATAPVRIARGRSIVLLLSCATDNVLRRRAVPWRRRADRSRIAPGRRPYNVTKGDRGRGTDTASTAERGSGRGAPSHDLSVPPIRMVSSIVWFG